MLSDPGALSYLHNVVVINDSINVFVFKIQRKSYEQQLYGDRGFLNSYLFL